MAKDLIDAIQMDVKSTKPCTREFEFTVPADVVSSETAKTLREFSGMAAIPGFRQGKAPVNMIKTRYEKEIKEELQRRLAYAAFDKINKDETLDILGCDMTKTPEIAFDKEIQFTLTAEVAPEFEVGDYQNMKVDVALDPVSDEQLNERIKSFCTMYGSYAAVEGGAKDGDMLKVSYTSDFVPAEDASAELKRQAAAENTFLWMSEPETIPGAIAALKGAEKGKSYPVEAKYAADYRIAELAGKTVKYTVTVDEVQRREELSEEDLAKKVNAASPEEFRATVRKSMEQQNESKRRGEAGDAVYKKLNESVAEFEMPENVLASSVNRELQKIAREEVKSEEDVEKFKSNLEEFRKKAETAAKDALRRTFILRKIAKLEKIELTQAEVEGQLNQMSMHYGIKSKELKDMMEKDGTMSELQLDILNAKVLDRLVEKALA